MYYQHFGLEEAPFSIAVNPRYLYMSPRHRDALAHLLYGVGAGGGFILLTGEVGTGKTTINRCLLEQLPDHADVAIVLNPALDVIDLLQTVCDELGIGDSVSLQGLKSLTDELHQYLLKNHAHGRKTVLMIDEAQHLSFDALEQIRLLTNLETNDEKLLHIILIGQPELAEKLARPELRQLNQRITARFDLQPLNLPETGAYIRHRLEVAGLSPSGNLFSNAMVAAIHRQTRGVPRLINLICDRMLLGAYGENKSVLDRGLFKRAVSEVLGISAPRWGFPMIMSFASVLILMIGLVFWQYKSTPIDATQPAVPHEGDTEAAREAKVVALPSSTLGPRASEKAAKDESWRFSPELGGQQFFRLYGLESSVGLSTPCLVELPKTMRCERSEARSWNEILRQSRPVLIELIDAQRFESRALLLGLNASDAQVATLSGVTDLPLEALAREWSGVVWSLQRRSPSIQRILKVGDRGADVAELARLFSLIDRQPRPLAESDFNSLLENRLMLFQRKSGLNADGVLGQQSLAAVLLAAGEDIHTSTAKTRWLAVLDSGTSAVGAGG